MSAGRSVFKDETKLDINYVPRKLVHREAEMRLLGAFFNFLLTTPEKMAQRVLIVGDVGTGKTVLSQRFGLDLAQQARQRGINLSYVHVNCRQYRGSLFLILHHAVSAFHPNFPKRGFSAEELLNIFLQVLDENNAYVLLTLDELESLIEREGSEAVYKLTRLQEVRLNKPQRVSFIGILKSLKAIEGLDASTRSTLQTNIVKLERYSKKQLVDIINDRVQLAFKQSTVIDETVDFIAELASLEGGNARFAIELLWRAGKYADAEDLNVVTPECVRKAVSSVFAMAKKSDLASLSLHEKLFLLGIARFFKENMDRAYASLTEVEQSYAVACEEFNAQPHTHTQLWKYLQTFSTLGIIKKSVSTVGRGRTTLIYLPGVSAYELEREVSAFLEREKMGGNRTAQ